MKTALRLRKNGDKTIDLGEMTIRVPKYIDSKGNDWDDLQKEFSPDTVKLLVDKTGMVRSYSTDITSLGIPEDEVMTVTEVDEAALPEEFFDPSTFTSWQWVAGKGVGKRIIPDDENVAENAGKKQALLSQVMQELQPLQLAVKYEMATGEESDRLEKLEKFLVSVNRIDVSQRDINWPAIP